MEFTKDIEFSKKLKENEESTITYKGYLYQKNSQEVTMVYGYGDSWDNTSNALMAKTDHGFEEAASTTEKMANEGETEQSEEKDEAKEAQMKFDVDDVIEGLGKAADKVADAAKYAAENPEKVIDKAADVAGKVAETIGKAADKALDQAQKVIDKTDKSANSASDQVGKVVDGIGKAAEKAANAFTSFLENLTRNDSDKK